jgi:hypothetical protein
MLRARRTHPSTPPIPIASDGIIRVSGCYYLADSFVSTRQQCVQINADDVDLNLNGNTVRYAGPAEASSIGIIANNRRNVKVHNGAVAGSQFGVLASGSRDVTIENVRFADCRYVGVSFGADNVGCVVRGCSFVRLMGWRAEAYAIGVNGVGVDGLVERCEFRELYRQPDAPDHLSGEGCGIIASAGATGVIVRYNLFANSELRKKKSIMAWVAGEASATFHGNTVVNFATGIVSQAGEAYDNVFWLRAPQPDSLGISIYDGPIHDNLVIGYTKPLVGVGKMVNNTVHSGDAIGGVDHIGR